LRSNALKSGAGVLARRSENQAQMYESCVAVVPTFDEKELRVT